MSGMPYTAYRWLGKSYILIKKEKKNPFGSPAAGKPSHALHVEIKVISNNWAQKLIGFNVTLSVCV